MKRNENKYLIMPFFIKILVLIISYLDPAFLFVFFETVLSFVLSMSTSVSVKAGQ